MWHLIATPKQSAHDFAYHFATNDPNELMLCEYTLQHSVFWPQIDLLLATTYGASFDSVKSMYPQFQGTEAIGDWNQFLDRLEVLGTEGVVKDE